MPFDLIGHQGLGRKLHHLRQEVHGEIGNADVPREAFPLHPAQRADGVGERDPRVRPMDQQKIDLGEAKLREALLGRALEFARREMVGPHLRGDEDVGTGHAGGPQPLADLALVAVHLGGVDMAIPEAQSVLDHSHAGALAQIPRPEADCGNAGAVGFNEWGGQESFSGKFTPRHPLLEAAARRSISRPSR